MVKKSIKKLSFLATIIIVFVIVSTLCGCNPVKENVDDSVVETFPTNFSNILNGKDVYVTLIGQAAIGSHKDEIVRKLRSLGVNSIYKNNLDLNDIKQPEKSVVFLITGCSIKGLAQYDLTIDNEFDRAKNFIEAKNITIIGCHTGGPARRGYTSDRLIEYVFKKTSFNMFTKDGNILGGEGDYALSNWSKKGGVPYFQANSISEILDALTKMAGKV